MSKDRFHRTLISITSVDAESGHVDAVVYGWWPAATVRIPIEPIQRDLPSEEIVVGARFIAEVTLEAASAEELRFQNFQLAPPPDDSDGLGGEHP